MTDSGPTPTGTDSPTAAAGDPAADGGSVVLLHVEPDARSAELLATFARRLADGIAVRSVDGMAAALDAVDGADCVVTEQRLPDGSGVELMERLRRRGSEVPVVFHTTCRGGETAAAARDAGADAYFSKRSERGQYDRVLERARGLVDGDDTRRARAATTVSTEAPRSSAEPPTSEE